MYIYIIADVFYAFSSLFGEEEQARKLQDAQAEKLTSLQAKKLTS